jgi:hypothetical protein
MESKILNRLNCFIFLTEKKKRKKKKKEITLQKGIELYPFWDMGTELVNISNWGIHVSKRFT